MKSPAASRPGSKRSRNGHSVEGRARGRRIRESVNAQIERFMGGFQDLEVVSKDFAPYQTANVSIMLKEYFEKVTPASKILGVRSGLSASEPSDLLEPARFSKLGHFEGVDATPTVYVRSLPEAVDSRLGLTNAAILFKCGVEPMVAFARTSERRMESAVSLSIIARDADKADKVLSEFSEYEHRRSIFRGRVIRPQINYQDDVVEAEILERRHASWDDAVLPADLLLEIRENIVGYIRSADAMTANGIDAKRGILFHGVPGTGKSFVANLLASELVGFTTILCSGENLERPAAVFKLARRFSPSLVLFEDVDLVGSKRDENRSLTVLSSIMNELDGVERLERVYALFTTNRIEAIEEALAQRPGRVDLIVEFPIPSRDLRERLLRLYAGKAELCLANVGPILEETDGVSPAFLKELMKRAVYIAVRKGEADDAGIARVTDDHVLQALSDLKKIESRAARKIIGFEKA